VTKGVFTAVPRWIRGVVSYFVGAGLKLILCGPGVLDVSVLAFEIGVRIVVLE